MRKLEMKRATSTTVRGDSFRDDVF